MEYAGIRNLLGKRICLRYDTGVSIVGVLLELRPSVGVPQMAILKDADIVSSVGTVLGHHDQLSVVPNQLSGFEEDSVPAISFRRPYNP